MQVPACGYQFSSTYGSYGISHTDSVLLPELNSEELENNIVMLSENDDNDTVFALSIPYLLEVIQKITVQDNPGQTTFD